MTIRELKEILANYPDNMEVAIDIDLGITERESPEYCYITDNDVNCFRTEEQAEEVAKRVREVLEKYHEEIGE